MSFHIFKNMKHHNFMALWLSSWRSGGQLPTNKQLICLFKINMKDSGVLVLVSAAKFKLVQICYLVF